MPDQTKKADAPAKADEAAVEFSHDGLRAVTMTKDADGGVTSTVRDATFEEMIAILAPQVLEQAIGIVHHAAGGEVSTRGNVITIKLEAM